LTSKFSDTYATHGVWFGSQMNLEGWTTKTPSIIDRKNINYNQRWNNTLPNKSDYNNFTI